ncbi:Xylose import ATP-binding protein XylG [Raoultella terrigena]|uniref:Xylose import ATP-binding protein XylG n=1 Tax=Raoultella terrigena TaxID=577 RepID=A0A4U9DFN9_RAOTE|nr:Xylose import ATP-binding protein XylG [Raoultella terrigena]
MLVFSSDAPELLGLCDRILVMWRGELVANLATQGLTLDALLATINGGTGTTAYEYGYPAPRPAGMTTLIEKFPLILFFALLVWLSLQFALLF